jgi:xanthine dehydrogenase iron-sulfur cluster and FAD-binding subunit A
VVITEAGLLGRSAFLKLGARSHLVIAIAMVAARLVVEDGRVAKAAVAVGSCSAVAVRLAAVEAALLGAPVAEAGGRVRAGDVQSALAPINDVRATAEYRLEASVELVRRAVAEAWA